MSKRSVTTTLGIVVAVLIVAVTVTLLMRGEPDTIRLGAVFPLSGGAQRIGSMKKDGADLAIEEINQKGGIHGKKLVIIYEDSQNEAAKGVSAFKKLADVDKVPVVMSAMSGVTMPMVPLAEEKKVVLFASVGHPNATGQNEWVFRNFPTAEQEAAAMVRFATEELKAKTAGILYPHDDWGMSGRDAFKRYFAAAGGSVLAEESYGRGESDFKTQLAVIKGKNPDVVYFTGFGNALAVIARQTVELKVKGHRLTTTGFNDKATIDLAKNAAEGVYLTTSAFDPSSDDATVRAFVAAFEKKFGRQPAFDEALQYDTVKMIAHAIEQSDGSAQGIREVLSKLRGFQGVIGKTSVSGKGDCQTPIVLKVVRGGSVVEAE